MDTLLLLNEVLIGIGCSYAKCQRLLQCVHVSAVINSLRHADIRMWRQVMGQRWCLGAACSLTVSLISQTTSSRFHSMMNGLCVCFLLFVYVSLIESSSP